MDCAFSVKSKYALSIPISPKFSTMSLSKNFLILHFIFMFVIHFELIFVFLCKRLYRIGVNS